MTDARPAGSNRGRRKRALAWLPASSYALLIWWLSSRPVTTDLIQEVPLQDKGVHFVEYGLMAVLVAYGAVTTWPRASRRYLAAAWIAFALGLTDEFHQAYVRSRTGDAADLLADLLGIAVFTVLYAVARESLERARKNALNPP